jgi:hypothetical protein
MNESKRLPAQKMPKDLPRIHNDAYDYYFFQLFAKSIGRPYWNCFSHWVKFADEGKKVEMRQASIVNASNMLNLLPKSQTCEIVHTLNELQVFFLLGGNALIKKSIAEKYMAKFLKPIATVKTGLFGFHALDSLPKTIFQRVPTKKLRMDILKRDQFRCLACGRSPYNNVDITLNVHHIRPWASGGATHTKNLITLCHTCHEGLDPHYDINLYKLISNGRICESPEKEYTEGIYHYRRWSLKDSEAENK